MEPSWPVCGEGRSKPPDQTKMAGLKRRKIASGMYSLIALGAVGMAIYLRLYVYDSVIVRQSSMEPTLHPQDRVIVNKRAYRRGFPKRGDIVALFHPQEGTLVLKRVIGLPGEVVKIRSEGVYINDQFLSEPYLGQKTMIPADRAYGVPAGHVFVLGDNRDQSEDSRDYGPLPLSRIKGRAVLIFWPREHFRKL